MVPLPATPMSRLDRWITVFLALLFAFSSLDKLAHFHGFVNAIDSYRVLPLPLGSLLAPLIIAAELTVAFGLWFERYRRAAAVQAGILTALFTVALGTNRLLGNRDLCGCWFSLDMAQGDIHFLFNATVIALSLCVWHASRSGRPGRRIP